MFILSRIAFCALCRAYTHCTASAEPRPTLVAASTEGRYWLNSVHLCEARFGQLPQASGASVWHISAAVDVPHLLCALPAPVHCKRRAHRSVARSRIAKFEREIAINCIAMPAELITDCLQSCKQLGNDMLFACRRMVNFGLFHLLDRARTVGFNAAVASLLQQPWVVFSCQIQTAADKQLKVSTLQFATAEGQVYIFDCMSLGTQAIHEHGLAWLLQSPSVKKIMYSSDNTATALWRQLKVQIDGAVDLQILSAMPQQWPILPPGSNRPLTDAIASNWTPASVTGRSDKRPHSFNSSFRTVSADASFKSGNSGQESPQAVLDFMLDDLEADAMQGPDLVYSFAKDASAGQKPDCGWQPKPRGRCSRMGSMSLLDSMQLMELPILPGGFVLQDHVQQMHACFSSAALVQSDCSTVKVQCNHTAVQSKCSAANMQCSQVAVQLNCSAVKIHVQSKCIAGKLHFSQNAVQSTYIAVRVECSVAYLLPHVIEHTQACIKHHKAS